MSLIGNMTGSIGAVKRRADTVSQLAGMQKAAGASARSAPPPVAPPPTASIVAKSGILGAPAGTDAQQHATDSAVAVQNAAAHPTPQGAAAPGGTASPAATPGGAAPSTVPDYSKVIKEIGGIYDTQRDKAAQQESANLQGQKEAMDRRFAAMGGGPGGASIKAEEQLGNESAQRLQGANADINAAQSGDMRNIEMTKLGQQFQSGERQAGQQFQAGQQKESIGAQMKMQLTGINAQSSQQDKEIAAQKLMQQTGLNAQEAMQAVNLKQQADQFEKTMGLEKDKFDEQTGVDQFNEKIAQQMADKKDFMDRALGPLTPSGNGKGPMSGVPSFMEGWF